MTRIQRIEFSKAVERAAKERAKGHCEGCGVPFDTKNRPQLDHTEECWEAVARGEKPKATLENARVLGSVCCHKPKSAAATRRRKKADRVRDKNVLNIKRPKAKIPNRGFTKARDVIEPSSIGSRGHRSHLEAMAKAGKPIVRPHWLKEKRRG